ncbi:MAG: type II secretion system F family protein [Candidatus Diapherotrites archaeon]|nr:type II secretion system F family protein [Candidatus Diapherotrites archaeon]
MGFEGFENLVSRKKREKLYSLMKFAGFEGSLQDRAGKIALYSIVFSLALFFALVLLFAGFVKIFDAATIIIVCVVSGIASYFLFIEFFGLQLYYKSESRAKKIEGILPDFLLLIANNIRAGLTPFAAFRQSARPEFGVLSEQAKIASAKSLGTQSFEKALQQLSASIDSRQLRETVALFAQSLKSGSHMAKLLESAAMDLRRIQELRKEMVSSVRTYVLFVGFVSLIAAPLLLAISIQFLSMLQGIQATQASSFAAGQVSFLNPKIGVSAAVMQNLSILLLLGNALFAGVFLGVLNQGKAKQGIKYFPLIFIVSLILFLVFQIVISSFFTSFFAFS